MSIDKLKDRRGPQNPAAVSQPMPTQGRKPVLPEIIKDLYDRSDEGVRKYGTPLQADNGRDALLDAYQEGLDLVQYLKQVIMERENPGIVYSWPETIYASRNSLGEQLDHILSEVDEITELGPPVSPLIHMEIADLQHSIETFWRILERQTNGEEYIAAVFQAVEDKNRKRGYYDIDADIMPCPSIEGPFGRMPYTGGGHAN